MTGREVIEVLLKLPLDMEVWYNNEDDISRRIDGVTKGHFMRLEASNWGDGEECAVEGPDTEEVICVW